MTLSMSKSEYRRLTGEKAPNKYNVGPADKRRYNDHTYDSIAEKDRAVELDLLVKAGEIHAWIRQPTFQLDALEYRADSLVWESAGIRMTFSDNGVRMPDVGDESFEPYKVHVEEVKGKMTQRFRDIVRMWRKHGPFPLKILRREGGDWTTEIVEGKP